MEVDRLLGIFIRENDESEMKIKKGNYSEALKHNNAAYKAIFERFKAMDEALKPEERSRLNIIMNQAEFLYEKLYPEFYTKNRRRKK